MKYCLSVGLHNFFYDIAIVDSNHKLIKKKKLNYDRNKDIASNIFLSYNKYFGEYKISYIGVGISNNIEFKDDLLYNVLSFSFHRYNLKQALYKLFKVDICIMEETSFAALSISYKFNCDSLLYVLIDNKISNSFVINNELVYLEQDINLKLNEKINLKCSKDYLKEEFLKNNLDDDYIGAYFLSNNENCKKIIEVWAKNLNVYISNIIEELPVKKVVFAGYIGGYLEEFKKYLKIKQCEGISNHREETLIGVSHLMFKDN